MLGEVCPELAGVERRSIEQRRQYPQAAEGRGAQGRHARRRDLRGRRCSPRRKHVGQRARGDWRRGSSLATPINIQYTSGTTGFPKAATLSHRNLLLNAFYVGGCQRFTADDRICIPVPFYHCFGCVLGTLGLRRVRRDDDHPGRVLSTRRRRSTPSSRSGPPSLYGVPTMFIAQLQDPSFARPQI